MQSTRVRNLFSTILGVGAIAGSMVLTSCEDEFTEEDAIKAQQETLMALNEQEDALARMGARVNYTVTVVDGGGANTNARTTGEAFAAGATVTVSQGGVSTPGTTTEGGVATFADLRAGEAVVTVAAEGFTTVTYTTNLGDNSSFELQEDNVETTIPIFPTTLAGGASEVSGMAWAETNALNDTPEFATGATVRATISVSTALSRFGLNFGSSSKGEVRSATYSDFVQTATVGDDGTYTLVIPNGNGDAGAGIPHNIEFLPFTAPQTYVKQQGDTLAVVTEDVVFDGRDDHSDYIKTNLPSVYAVIEAPVNNASGFELMAEAQRSSLDEDAMKISARGTGYEVGDRFNFEADEDDEVSYIEVTEVNDDGVITDWTLRGFGEYDAKPAMTDASTTGSGASFVHEFATRYDVKVKSSGSEYFALPEMKVSYQTYVNGVLVTKSVNVDNDDLNIVSGKVTSAFDAVIDNTPASASMPTFTITNAATAKAVILAEDITVEDDGTISGISLDESGSGYTSQPTITIKTAGENMGSGATAVANINEDGEVTSISMVNPGSGYIAEVNDIYHSSTDTPDVQDVNESNTVKPGASKANHNFNYSNDD